MIVYCFLFGLFVKFACLSEKKINKKLDQEQSYQWTGNINCSLEDGRKTQDEAGQRIFGFLHHIISELD